MRVCPKTANSQTTWRILPFQANLSITFRPNCRRVSLGMMVEARGATKGKPQSKSTWRFLFPDVCVRACVCVCVPQVLPSAWAWAGGGGGLPPFANAPGVSAFYTKRGTFGFSSPGNNSTTSSSHTSRLKNQQAKNISRIHFSRKLVYEGIVWA